MQFVEFEFLIQFLPIALILHRIAIHFNRGQVYGATARITIFLLTLYYYGKHEPRWLIPLSICIVFDFVWATLLTQTSSSRWRGVWLIASISQNIILLGLYKYPRFIIENLSLLPGAALTAGEIQALPTDFPAGISFYTFESLSFVIDVYRRRVKPPRSPLEFFAFIAMFPRFIAGPIVRYRDMVDQFTHYHGMQWREGLNLFAAGLFLKRVFADSFNHFVPLAFDGSPGFMDAWVGVISYTMQIYCDFFGYSLMAIGLGRVLGFEFAKNFDRPYLSRSITEFWQRWHMSLSSWLRDYLYIPLGGNRQGHAKTLRNILLTMLIGGLWHGASWTFVLWGAIHGTLLCVERTWKIQWGRYGTLLWVAVAWVFFKADTLSEAMQILHAMVSPFRQSQSQWNVELHHCIGATLGLLYVLVGEINLPWIERALTRLDSELSLALVTLALVIPFGSESKSIPFLYFQF